MGNYDDEDEDNYSVQMIPKAGAAPIQQTGADQQRIQSMRPTLSQSDQEVAGAKKGWAEALENSLRQNIGAPIESAVSALTGKADRAAAVPQQKSPMGSLERGRVSDADLQPGQDIYEQIMQERQQMLEQGLDPNAPEQMQRFQKIRQSLLKRGGA